MKFSSKAGKFWIALLLLLPMSAHAQTDPVSTAKLFEEAAAAREEAAHIWEDLGEKIRASEAWGEAAVSWEKAATAWETAGQADKAAAAWDRFRAAITKRDQAEIKMVVVSGSGQKVRVGRLADQLVTRVTDKAGKPLVSVTVVYDIVSRPSPGDGGRVEPHETKTDSDGIVTARLRAGTAVGTYTVLASVPDLSREPASFQVATTPGPAARLEIVGGNNQVLKVNQRAISPLVTRITDLYGNPVENVTINYRIVSEPEGAIGQSLSAEDASTDASGLAGVRFQAGNLGGSYIVLVECGDMEGSPSKFELIVRQTIPTLRITGILIEGVEDTAQLLAGTKLKVGETYLLPEMGRYFRDEIHRLYATGRFEDVKASIVEGATEDEGQVVLKVVERSKVASVKLVGLKKVKESDVRGVMTLSDGSPYSQSTLERARSAIAEYLENEGYLHARVAIETSVVDAGKAGAGKPATIAVTFRIAENDKVKIYRMNLIGNKYYSDWTMNWHMKTGSGRVYKQSEFEEDRQKMIGKYVEHGYLSASMEDPVIRYDEKGRMILDILISEGPQYKIGDVKFEGNTAVSTGELMGMLRPQPGDVFRAQKFFQSIEKMRLATAKFGYAEARVSPQEKLDPARGVVDFTIKVAEGQVLYLEGIAVEGNTKTRDKIVTREINLRPGDRLNGDEIEKARKKLEALGFFEPQSVRMDLKPGTNSDRRILQVKVAEGKTGQLQFGGGYSSVDKLVGFLSISKKNFDPFDFWSFTGAGQEVTVSAEYGAKKNSFSGSWTEPYFRNRPISLGFDAFNTYQELEGYDQKQRGGAIRISHKYGEYGRMSYKYGVDQVELLRVSGLAPTDIQNEAGFPTYNRFIRTTTSLTTGYTRDSRDDIHYPMTGSVFDISNQLAGRFFGGNVSFDRPFISWSKFTKTFGNQVLAVRMQYSTISNFFERSNPIPTAEKFTLGGANTIRGYRDRSIQVYNRNGTLEGPGRSYALGNIEYRIPFTEDKSVSMALFYDVGGVYEGEYAIGFRNLVAGVGAGVRFNSPLGPIRLDYGWGLNFPNQGKGQLHFSIGQAF